VIGAFLTHLETGRGNGVTTRNARLVAIHSLFRYASLHVPEHAGLISRVLAIPGKRHDHPTVCFLTREEIGALLAAPDTATWTGRRDHALLTAGVQAVARR
jgi:integrase/recombinase XerD